MTTWLWLILASLLTCAGQLCQKQATRPAKAGRRGAHIMLWLGLALLALGSGMLVWLVVLQRLPVFTWADNFDITPHFAFVAQQQRDIIAAVTQVKPEGLRIHEGRLPLLTIDDLG